MVPSGAEADAGTAEMASCTDGIERLPRGLDALDAESLELGEELAADDVHALNQRVVASRARPGGVDGAIEVVDDVEEIGEDFAPATLDVLRDLAPQPRPRFLELGGRSAITRDGVLQLLVLFRELLFELLDVGGLERRRRLRAGPARFRVLVGPPPPIDDLDRDLVLFVVAHRAAWGSSVFGW